jgi:uncharacterized membrane protein
VTKIAATEEQVFTVPASPEEVYAFFLNPDRLREALACVEHHEVLPDDRVRWVFEEKVDKGIRFKADFVVAYAGNGADHVAGHSVAGNLGNAWDAWIRPAPGGGSEVRYHETVVPELPITAVTALLIKPLVVRELRNDVTRFLGRVKDLLSATAATR